MLANKYSIRQFPYNETSHKVINILTINTHTYRERLIDALSIEQLKNTIKKSAITKPAPPCGITSTIPPMTPFKIYIPDAWILQRKEYTEGPRQVQNEWSPSGIRYILLYIYRKSRRNNLLVTNTTKSPPHAFLFFYSFSAVCSLTFLFLCGFVFYDIIVGYAFAYPNHIMAFLRNHWMFWNVVNVYKAVLVWFSWLNSNRNILVGWTHSNRRSKRCMLAV